MKFRSYLTAFAVGASLALPAGTAAIENKTKLRTKESLLPSAYYWDGDLSAEDCVMSAVSSSDYKAYSKEFLGVIRKRESELEKIVQFEGILGKFAENIDNQSYLTQNGLSADNKMLFAMTQNHLASKLVAIYESMPDDPDINYLMGEFFNHYSRSGEMAIFHYKKSLDKSGKYLDEICNGLFKHIIERIKADDGCTGDEHFLAIIRKFKDHIGQYLAEGLKEAEDDEVKMRFEEIMKRTGILPDTIDTGKTTDEGDTTGIGNQLDNSDFST